MNDLFAACSVLGNDDSYFFIESVLQALVNNLSSHLKSRFHAQQGFKHALFTFESNSMCSSLFNE